MRCRGEAKTFMAALREPCSLALVVIAPYDVAYDLNEGWMISSRAGHQEDFQIAGLAFAPPLHRRCYPQMIDWMNRSTVNAG
jgi:hypothetical protein